MRVDVFDYDPPTGAIENRRPLATVAGARGAGPDGMAVDAEGCLWVAMHGGLGAAPLFAARGADGRSPSARLEGDELLLRGRDLKDLYVTTRREGLSERSWRTSPSRERCCASDVGVTGLPTYPFAG